MQVGAQLESLALQIFLRHLHWPVQVGAQLESLVQAGGGLVEGTVQRVTFRADDTGYSVLQVKVAHATGMPPLLAALAAPAAAPAKAGGRRRSLGACAKLQIIEIPFCTYWSACSALPDLHRHP